MTIFYVTALYMCAKKVFQKK